MSTSPTLDGVFLRKVWKRLRDSPVPIVIKQDYEKADEIASILASEIESHTFLPATIHGYLGIQKGGGVTRFLPILTARDMGVYYHLCYSLAPAILSRRDGVFGAWHMKPDVPDDLEREAEAFGHDYGSTPFSSHYWLKEWQRFTDLIREIIADKQVGRYVVTTDIANFYDSIEVPRLIRGLSRATNRNSEEIEALSAFLSSWNRRHMGYMPSTKGVPQEIISDASRILSHFYLQEFDKEFLDYCSSKALIYVRWSDDFLIFGSSRDQLRVAVHHMSRLLRDIGLNLNSGKTQYMTKSQLRNYRALDILNAIQREEHAEVVKKLAVIRNWMSLKRDFRQDTVFRAMIGYLTKFPNARSTPARAFVHDVGSTHRQLLHSLNHTQFLRYIQLMDDPIKSFHSIRRDISRASFGAPKANYLHMMRKYRNQLAGLGMTKRHARTAVTYIERHATDSDVIQKFCLPAVRDQYGL